MKLGNLTFICIFAIAVFVWLTRWEYHVVEAANTSTVYRMNRITGTVEVSVQNVMWYEIK